MELSALVAHILAVYQDRYAGESFIGTALAASSLVRHARRLSYQPDAGLAATGHVVLFVKPGLSGTIAKGLALASVPLGEAEAQDYETLADLPVDAGVNLLCPADAERSVSIAARATSFGLEGTGLGLETGEMIALVGAGHWQGLVIAAAEEDAERGTTTVSLASPLAAAVIPASALPDGGAGDEVMRVLAKPELVLRPFGWNADAALYPPGDLKSATATEPAGGAAGYWYDLSGASYSTSDIFLSEDLPNSLAGQYAMRVAGSGRHVFRIDAESSLSLSFHRRIDVPVETYTVKVTPDGSGGFTTSLEPHSTTVPVKSHIAAAVKAVRVKDPTGATQTRASQPLPAAWLTGWRQEFPLARSEPNPDPVEMFVDVPGRFPLLAPGRRLLFSNRAGTVTQVVAVSRVSLDAAAETTFTVFFGADTSAVTPESRPVLARAAAQFTRLGATSLVTTGHTDRFGSAPYNLVLSQRYADAVKGALVALGLPAAGITAIGRGESSPLVPTEDGVREARNRRVEIEIVQTPEALAKDEAGATRIWWDPVDPTPEGGWFKHNLRIYGNVVRVSHGREVTEVLGGSDGVQPFQRFPLKQSPVTLMPTATGAAPELTVRVNDVCWQRVDDFALSGPDDRHYRFELDETRKATVVFGGGRNGAIPPAGRKNISADYRVGLGTAGDVDAGLLTRVKQAHPLLDRIANLTDVSGGAEPASAEDIRTQATRFIRTFDRAVSVADHADVALLYEGVARAAARWNPERGIVLVVATASGEAPEAVGELRAFLDARRDTTLPMVIIGPTARAAHLSVIVDPDPDYLPEQVKDAIRAALYGVSREAPGYFAFARRGLGQPAFLSEIYRILETLDGVRNLEVTRFDAGDVSRILDVIRVAVDEWLTLDANDLELSTRAEAL